MSESKSFVMPMHTAPIPKSQLVWQKNQGWGIKIVSGNSQQLGGRVEFHMDPKGNISLSRYIK